MPAGPAATVANGLLVSGLGSSPRVHTAPLVPQAAPPASETVTASSASGSTSISHSAWLPLTRRARVTVPPVADSAASRKVA